MRILTHSITDKHPHLLRRPCVPVSSRASRVARRNVPSNSQCRNETPRTPLTPVVSSPRTSFTSASPLSRRHPKREPSGDPPEYRFRRTSTCFHTYNEPNRPSVTLTTALIPFTLTPPSTPTSTPTPTSNPHSNLYPSPYNLQTPSLDPPPLRAVPGFSGRSTFLTHTQFPMTHDGRRVTSIQSISVRFQSAIGNY